MANITTNRDIAIAHADSLRDLGWKIESEVAEQPDGSFGFVVVQPFRVTGAGRKARVTPATRQLRCFTGHGEMVVSLV